MSEENKTRARRAGQITSPDDLDLIEEVCAPDLVWHEPDQDVRGIEEAKRYVSDAPASPPLILWPRHLSMAPYRANRP
jgi:hypothetical protein